MSGLDERLFQDVNEKVREHGGFSSFMRGLPRARSYIARTERFTSDDELFGYQCEIIRNLADQESCVIVGKCADYVLRDRENVVSVYIDMGVTEKVAHATISRTDQYRADYYAYYTHGNYWTNPVNYDMTLNSEKVGIHDCVRLIEQYLLIKGFVDADDIKADA